MSSTSTLHCSTPCIAGLCEYKTTSTWYNYFMGLTNPFLQNLYHSRCSNNFIFLKIKGSYNIIVFCFLNSPTLFARCTVIHNACMVEKYHNYSAKTLRHKFFTDWQLQKIHRNNFRRWRIVWCTIYVRKNSRASFSRFKLDPRKPQSLCASKIWHYTILHVLLAWPCSTSYW